VNVIAPGKLVLTGAYAVLEGAPAIVAAVDRYAVVDTQSPGKVDVRSLHDEAGQKLGLGSSAASLVASFGAMGAGAASPPAYVVIVHPTNPTTSVSRRFLADAFLKKTTRWDNGETIRPVDQAPDTSVRRRFSDEVLKRSVAAVRNYWQQIIFAGRGGRERIGALSVQDHLPLPRVALDVVRELGTVDEGRESQAERNSPEQARARSSGRVRACAGHPAQARERQ